MHAKQLCLKHSLYVNPDTCSCRHSPSPLTWMLTSLYHYVCFIGALHQGDSCSLFASPITCLSSSWLPPAIILSDFTPQAAAACLHSPSSERTTAQALGKKRATAAAINPFTRFLPCYHIERAAPLASSGITAGTPWHSKLSKSFQHRSSNMLPEGLTQEHG